MFNFWLLKELSTLDVPIFELKGHSGSADKKLNRVEHHYQYHGPGNISSGWNCNNRICPCDVIMWVIGWWGGGLLKWSWERGWPYGQWVDCVRQDPISRRWPLCML